MNKYPRAFDEEGNSLKLQGDELKKATEKALEEAEGLLKKNPDVAYAKTVAVREDVVKFQGRLQMFNARKQAFDRARQSCPGKVQEAERAISDVLSRLQGLAGNKYLVSPEKELKPLNNEMKAIQSTLVVTGDVPDYPAVIRQSEEIKRKAGVIVDAWQKRINLQEINNQGLREAWSWSKEKFPRLKDAAQASLERLKAKTPSEVWEPVLKSVNEAAKMEVETLLQTAGRLNDMANQKFEAAAETIERISALRKEISASLVLPEITLQRFIEAQSNAKNLAQQVSGTITSAERAANDSDAEGRGRGKIREARNKVAEAERLQKTAVPNWLIVAGLLASAIGLAQVGRREAENRAEEVEAARRHAAAEAARRRQREEESSHSYYPTHSSSTSIGSSGSGFGGFGGGGFGGGGASGSW